MGSSLGPSKEELWKQLAHEIGWTGGRVDLQQGKQIITLDSHVSIGTAGRVPVRIEQMRLRAPLRTRGNFRIAIRPKDNLFSEVATWLGLLQDIVVGHPEIDEPFVIQGTDIKIVTSLFGNASIRKPIVETEQIVVALHDTKAQFARNYPPGAAELSLQVSRIVRPIDELLQLVDLFCEIKEQLRILGAAEGIDETTA